jgi:2,3-diketo-5-methylthiopentyl-1-phosphate enolase
MGEEQSFLTATYLVSGSGDFYKRAEKIAVGLTVGTWTGLSPEEKNRFIKHLGKVEDVKVLPKDEHGQERALLSISFPVINVTVDFPSLLTTIFGKGSMDGKIRLVDVDIPESLRQEFPGPKFGIDKIRNLLGVYDRPLLMSIFKQCIGLNSEELNKAYQSQLEGGVDLIKDDEIFFRDEAFPALKRVASFEEKNRRYFEQTGKKVLYAVNLTGPVTQLADQAKRLIEAGASCLLLNVFAYGLDVLQQLAADPNIHVPLMAHPAVAGALYQSPEYGIASPLLFGKFLRWAGTDFVLFPSPYGSVALPEEEAFAISSHLTKKDGIHRAAFPVPSAGIHPGLVPLLFEDFGLDFVVNAGGGIHGHQGGSAAGGKAFLHAIEAVVSGYTLEEGASYSPELQQAIKQWGVASR